MKSLKFSKQILSINIPQIINLDIKQAGNFNKEIQTNGNVHIISRSSFEEGAKYIVQAGYINCGKKKEKVELFRNLKFHLKKNLQQPRYIIFETSNYGAFKRSLQKFFNDRYNASFPPCIIIVSDEIFDVLSKNFLIVENKKTTLKKYGNDPIHRLLSEVEEHPIIKAISSVYVGSSYDMKLARLMILRASKSKSPVLIIGETGTGKDVIATQIWTHSIYNKKSFIAINCSSFPEDLLEGELFGYKAGIFSGALKDKIGLFQAYTGGTILLDEIADLSLSHQAKILLTIETKKVRPIVSNKIIDVDVRLIAATNKNIREMVTKNLFRLDLYYRLNGINIVAPSLRSHPEDIPIIAEKIWNDLNPNCKLSKEFIIELISYSWRGNVRELRSILINIIDLFGYISPTPEHLKTMFKSKQNIYEIDV